MNGGRLAALPASAVSGALTDVAGLHLQGRLSTGTFVVVPADPFGGEAQCAPGRLSGALRHIRATVEQEH